MLKTISFDKLAGVELGHYRLERYLGQSKIGPTFLARVDVATTYLVRFLDSPIYSMARERDVYLDQFQYRARLITTLQHPYILPLLDYGIYRGLPYLVSPHIPLRTLRTRVTKYGTLDTFTIGRYLDQIATALDYSHEHAMLHGSLSVDSIFVRLDGNLVVADVGVKSLLEHETGRNQPIEWSDGCAPEQLLGKPASPTSDVYALGMVIYYLLTGMAVFEGDTPEALAHQHLYAPLPPLNQVRGDLPPSLSGVLARALAKDPAQRYSQPGAFANAYHRSGVPTNRMRVPFVASEMQSAQAPETGEAAYYERGRGANGSGGVNGASEYAAARSLARPSNPSSLHGFPEDEPLSLLDAPRPALMRRLGSKQRQRNILIIALVAMLVIASITIGITATRQNGAGISNASGQVTFFANQNDPAGQTNSLRIAIQNLAAPASGSEYYAWIIDDQTEQVTPLGTLTEKGQAWTLTFSSPSVDVPASGDKLEITQEQGAASAPAGQVILTGTFPVKSFAHIQHLLVSFPQTPGKIGFLQGLLAQTHLLDNQAIVLQSVASSKNTEAIECVAQGMLDIIEGSHGPDARPLAVGCSQQDVSNAGDGYGLLGKTGYAASAEEHASFALGQPDATSAMRQHAALMDTALTNVTGWVTQVEKDLLNLRAHPTDLSSLQQIATLPAGAYHGVDATGTGQLEAVPGEAGALTADQQGQ